ncbi:MAG: ATP-binding protein [Oligoflexales bacterium]
MSKNPQEKTDELQLTSALAQGLTGNIFENIVRHFPDIIHSVDENGRLVSVNLKAVELLEYTEEELIGKSVFEIYADEVVHKVKIGFKQLKQEGIMDHIESKLKSKSGKVIDVEMRSLSLYSEDGKFIKTFSIIRDIRALNNMKSQLIQQSKLAAIGELASGIMHDIRNPLSVITSCNDYLLDQAIKNDDKKLMEKCRQKMTRASGKIQKLTDHLRSFSRLDQEKKETIDLRALMDDCLLMVENRVKESGATITCSDIDENTKILGRENQLEQVIINLLSNACDAIKENKNKSIDVKFSERGAYSQISIKDYGEGIKEENLEHIFDAFFTTKPKGLGTGLGLSISYAIIQDHGGELCVESSLGEGAEFIIKIPRIE